MKQGFKDTGKRIEKVAGITADWVKEGAENIMDGFSKDGDHWKEGLSATGDAIQSKAHELKEGLKNMTKGHEFDDRNPPKEISEAAGTELSDAGLHSHYLGELKSKVPEKQA
jgi:hypothetical protein